MLVVFVQTNKNQSRTIMALVPEGQVDEIVEGIEEITGDLDKKQGAMVCVVDVPFYKGTMKTLRGLSQVGPPLGCEQNSPAAPVVSSCLCNRNCLS